MNELFKLVARVLGVPPASVSPETGPMTEAKWDSFHHVNLVMVIEATYGVELSPDEIISLLNVEDIANVLKGKGVELA